MPTYEYECLPNGHRFEVKQSFTDPTLTACVECAEPVRKIYSAAGIVFKGSGYYVTDSRKPAPANGSSGSADKGEKSADKGSGDKGETSTSGSADSGASAKGGDAKPAAAPAKADTAKSTKSA